MINTSKPSTSVSDTTKASSAELWSTITTSWATETRTWQQMSSFMTNTAKRLLGSYTFDEIGTFSGDQIGNLTFESPFGPIFNTPKP